jgi:hypothetical protein
MADEDRGKKGIGLAEIAAGGAAGAAAGAVTLSMAARAKDREYEQAISSSHKIQEVIKKVTEEFAARTPKPQSPGLSASPEDITKYKVQLEHWRAKLEPEVEKGLKAFQKSLRKSIKFDTITKVEIGAAIATAALAAGGLVNRWLNSGKGKTFTERLEAERAAPTGRAR